MPALPVVENVLQLTIGGNTPAYPWINILHWGYSGGAPSATDANNIALELYTVWVAQFGPLMVNLATILKATAVDLTSELGAAGQAEGVNNGSRGADSQIPPSTSVLVTKTLGRRYRGGHPRSYIFAGLHTDLDTPTIWNGGFVGDVQAAYSAVVTALDAFVAGTTTLTGEVTVSYYSKALDPVPPSRRVTPLVLPVTSHTAQAHIATQRRRIGR